MKAFNVRIEQWLSNPEMLDSFYYTASIDHPDYKGCMVSGMSIASVLHELSVSIFIQDQHQSTNKPS